MSQCHAPMALMQAKGLAFDPATGEASSSHASNASGGSSGSSDTVKARVLRAFADFPSAFLDVVASTPEEAITQHGLYQRPPEQIPDQWYVCWAPPARPEGCLHALAAARVLQPSANQCMPEAPSCSVPVIRTPWLSAVLAGAVAA